MEDTKHTHHQRSSGYHGWRSTSGLSKLKFLQARLSYALQVRTRTAAEARRASEEQLKRQRRMSIVSSKSSTCMKSKRTSTQEVANTTKANTIAWNSTQQSSSSSSISSSSCQTELLSYLLTQAFFKRSLADFLTPIDALKFGQTSRNAQLIKLLPPAAIFQKNSLRWYKQQHHPPVMAANSNNNASSSSWQPLPLRHRSADIHAVCLTTTCRWCDRCLGGRVDVASPNNSSHNNTVSVIAIMQGDNNSSSNCRICCQDLSPRAVLAHHPSRSESSFIFRADHENDRVIRGYSVWARVGGGGVHFLHARRLCLRESVYASPV
mmetsp:Transcript_18147/g.28229  ORF Transcript_18147/g.28229 Transcript_18147/m.28229 type:complete len:322 (+) Transcript_18147:277-1242(+)|eukprot:CAMPEP_0196814260 /NCGR_PEP_ID=MMETSP1362-20130617/42191_1 /TAXON_ID=163516 /ORGANISM="Leptocylindrus danicus, Strain CCMP1856" /LENGTH=321 /DNA_ID=CAMNT_0042190813 /DNA_START=249 /DNA_END=1214 /DNA_ORIENTATION=+